MRDRIVNDSLTLVRALGYDMNSVEWAVRDGVPYAIDFMNPAPDMDIYSLTPDYFEWVVQTMADMAIRLAKEPRPAGQAASWNGSSMGRLTRAVTDGPRRWRRRAPSQAWHDRLAGATGAESAAQLEHAVADRGLFFGDRPLCTVLRPRFLYAAAVRAHAAAHGRRCCAPSTRRRAPRWPTAVLRHSSA